MAWADAAGAVNKTVQQILLERELKRLGVHPTQLAQRKLQREDEEFGLRKQEMDLRRQDIEANRMRQARMDEEASLQKAAAEANVLGDQLPAETFLGSHDPAVGMMQRGGRGSLLTSAEYQRPAMGEDFAGPMQTG